MSMEIQKFVQERSALIKKYDTAISAAYWELSTRGSEDVQKQIMQLREEYFNLLANREDFEQIKTAREAGTNDPLLDRQLEALYTRYIISQLDSATLQKIIQLETQITSEFANFRAQANGKRLSNNEILDLLQTSTNTEERKTAWLASKEIGKKVAPTLLELVALRNQAAKHLGYSDFYSMSLAIGELNEKELFEILDRLKKLTDEPFRKGKSEIDATLAKKFNLRPEELMPWHYSDLFFQETPASDEVNLNQFFVNQDVVALSKKYYDGIGLEIDAILERSDLYEREGKDQHAFCTHIGGEGDVRILCNCRNTEYWMNTMLHELGHAVYDQYLDFNLPYLLRSPAHSFTTEGIAMMFGRLSREPEWLKQIVGADAEMVDRLKDQLFRQEQLALLIFIRWALVMVYFERQLYKNPAQDLNKLWWDLVEELQFLRRPAGEANPDWASKVHLGGYPVYYQNYILGYLAAYQFEATIRYEVKVPHIVNNPEIGKFLIEKVFEPAARYHWTELMERATGHPLLPDFAVNILNID